MVALNKLSHGATSETNSKTRVSELVAGNEPSSDDTDTLQQRQILLTRIRDYTDAIEQ
jgi:hypothetical protein